MALFVSFAYFNGNAGCEVSGPQPAILLVYAFHAWLRYYESLAIAILRLSLLVHRQRALAALTVLIAGMAAPCVPALALILVRRDNIEHLVLIGGPTDVVVEANIVRAAPARQR
jgi:hypothetical protein